MGRVQDKTVTTASTEHYTRHTAMLNQHQPLTIQAEGTNLLARGSSSVSKNFVLQT